MESRITVRIGEAVSHVANVMMEQIRDLVNVVEQKYEQLPVQVARVRADLDEHRSDLRLHARSPATPPKRITKKKPRSR